MDGVFLSEEIGVEKPNAGFFQEVFRQIGPSDLSSVLIVGDSLTSDMQGGINAGIRTCWYNPDGLPAPRDKKLDFVISDLHQVWDCLG